MSTPLVYSHSEAWRLRELSETGACGASSLTLSRESRGGRKRRASAKAETDITEPEWSTFSNLFLINFGFTLDFCKKRRKLEKQLRLERQSYIRTEGASASLQGRCDSLINNSDSPGRCMNERH
ncbi:hypothetical protein CHARACLAT_027215 [Characodon lateralis]|uniref:Uncharacterized protein n=1 Tax=Characodon lateralis TaxID=208331 RepID=A0ABU7DD32_9TELE|nr:hypothetical protein [Characodon lateralis]